MVVVTGVRPGDYHDHEVTGREDLTIGNRWHQHGAVLGNPGVQVESGFYAHGVILDRRASIAGQGCSLTVPVNPAPGVAVS